MALPLYEQFAQTFVHMCRHDGDGGHGYTQDARWGNGTTETVTLSDGSHVTIAGGDRDCSSGIISALKAVGVDVHGASYTGNMRSSLLKTGLFEWYPMSVPHYARRGDIYLNEGHHTAMCVSDSPDTLAQFSINEKGRAHGGRVGDQTGHESNIRSYYSYPWDGRLCWRDRGGSVAPAPAPIQPTPQPNQVGQLDVDGWPGYHTITRAQEVAGTPVDHKVSGQAAWVCNQPGIRAVGGGVWERGRGGSLLIQALQRQLGCDPDGYLGPDTWHHMEDRAGVERDNVISSPSLTIKWWQRQLNEGRLA